MRTTRDGEGGFRCGRVLCRVPPEEFLPRGLPVFLVTRDAPFPFDMHVPSLIPHTYINLLYILTITRERP